MKKQTDLDIESFIEFEEIEQETSSSLRGNGWSQERIRCVTKESK